MYTQDLVCKAEYETYSADEEAASWWCFGPKDPQEILGKVAGLFCAAPDQHTFTSYMMFVYRLHDK